MRITGRRCPSCLPRLTIRQIDRSAFGRTPRFDGASPDGCADEEASAKQRAKWKTRRCSRSGHSVPCRYSSRGRHVTLNIGRKPKLITTTSILLGMLSPFSSPSPSPSPFAPNRVTGVAGIARGAHYRVDVDVVHLPFFRRSESIPALSPSLCLAEFPPPSPGVSMGKLGQRATASRRFAIVEMVRRRGNGGKGKQERERERETKKRRY